MTAEVSDSRDLRFCNIFPIIVQIARSRRDDFVAINRDISVHLISQHTAFSRYKYDCATSPVAAFLTFVALSHKKYYFTVIFHRHNYYPSVRS